ncbi:MAG: hypothetical protein EOM34_00115 [Clostridia bacterium]|nr:hypothetical protein [Clostridia bacterium]NCD03496.1 hypothetical protein [Clostridia bacterium]
MTGIICLMMWILCGCMGNTKISIDTSLTVNKNFKGSREMSAVISDSVFKRAFNGDLEELQKVVTEKCPSTMICSAEEVNNGVEITMTLEFASLSDYTNKIGQILGKTPGIYYDASNSIFKSGYMIQENFSSQELFNWLLEALKEEYTEFSDAELGDIFTNGKTQVIYEDETIETSEQIHVEKMDSHTFDTLSVELTMNDDDSYGVLINFIVSKEVYYDMGDKMDDAIKKLAPDGGVYEVNEVDEQRVYTIGFSAYNETTLLSQLNSVLQTKNCEFKVEENGDESDPFRANKVITLYLDGSYFLDFSKDNAELVYKLNAGSEYSFDQCESLTGFLKDYSYDHSDKYTSVYMTVGPSDQVRISLSYAIDIQKIEAYTKITSDTSLDRSMTFKFDSEKAALMGETFENKLRARMDEDMTLDVTDEEGVTSYRVNIHGKSVEELSLKTTKFLDGSANEENLTSMISGGKSKRKMLRTKSYTFEDRINFQQFLGSAAVDEGISYQIDYPSGYTAAFENGSYTDMVTSENTLTCTTKDQILVVSSNGATANVSGVSQLIIWWASLILTIFSLVMNLKHIAGYIRHRQKYLLKTDLSHGRNQVFLTVGTVALVVFLFTSLRMIFRVY